VVTQLAVIGPDSPPPSAGVDFGAALFALRMARGLSQRDLAREAGVAISVLSATENGRRRPPTEGTVQKLCDALDASKCERTHLHRLAALERLSIGLRVSRRTPRHVADLLRDISRIGHQLSVRQVAVIRCSLTEVAMK
jgi:transcriptional regulator with XRE-family HTH domain